MFRGCLESSTERQNQYIFVMIIDLILDRKDGAKYSPREFYFAVLEYRDIWPELSDPITKALDGGTEKDIKRALCDYVLTQGYNPEICDYINRVSWL